MVLIDSLEWTGAALGIAGWLGVRQIGNADAQLFGMAVWVISGILLLVWGIRTESKGIVAVNAVNVFMAASGIVAVMLH
jgi:hypothetical protein